MKTPIGIITANRPGQYRRRNKPRHNPITAIGKPKPIHLPKYSLASKYPILAGSGIFCGLGPVPASNRKQHPSADTIGLINSDAASTEICWCSSWPSRFKLNKIPA